MIANSVVRSMSKFVSDMVLFQKPNLVKIVVLKTLKAFYLKSSIVSHKMYFTARHMVVWLFLVE